MRDNNEAIFFHSLGVYALGSGALGYSERRSNPRRSFRAPLLPPIQAAPNLIPAAVNSPDASQQIPVLVSMNSGKLKICIKYVLMNFKLMNKSKSQHFLLPKYNLSTVYAR